METAVERIDATTVKLTVTVEAERVDAAIDEAATRLASEVKIPGFRPGRVPRRVLENRVGTATLVSEAVREALPGFYSEAISAEEVQVVSQPELDIDTFEPGADATFTATVQVRPEIEVPDVSDLQVPHPEWELSDDEVTEQLDMLRERFAELETVDRKATVGDVAVITLIATADGERVDAASGEDQLYHVGDPDETDEELDRQVIGMAAGKQTTFTDTLGEDFGDELAGTEVEMDLTVTEVKIRKLPDLDDDFAVMASEFDTAEELTTELRRQMAEHKLSQASAELRGKVVEAVAERVGDVPIPAAMVDEELRFRFQRMATEAERYGMELEQYLAAMNLSAEEATERMREDAERTVTAQLVVDAVGRAQDITIENEDLQGEIIRQAQRLDRSPDELAQLMTHPDRIGALVSDAFRRKAIDHLLATVQVLSSPPEGLAEELAAAAPAPDTPDESPDEAPVASPDEGAADID